MERKKIDKQTKGYLANVGPDIKVRRTLPSVEIRDLNPMVFLDVMRPLEHIANPNAVTNGTGAHPHRGFCTFTYVLSGEIEHFDSKGHHGVVKAGGGQWMKAGNGIIHDERPTLEMLRKGGIQQGFQLWINLPAAHKNDEPAYQPLHPEDVQEVSLSDGTVVRVLIGTFADKTSPIPTYTPQAVLHVKLAANSTIDLPLNQGWHTAIYLESGDVTIAEQVVSGPKMVTISKAGDLVNLQNDNDHVQDLFILTALPLEEPMLAHGPFVMNNEAGIMTAYRDYELGKYGQISYN